MVAGFIHAEDTIGRTGRKIKFSLFVPLWSQKIELCLEFREIASVLTRSDMEQTAFANQRQDENGTKKNSENSAFSRHTIDCRLSRGTHRNTSSGESPACGSIF
jgi:hypothetical protein